jgi:dihydroneopterin aldolase
LLDDVSSSPPIATSFATAAVVLSYALRLRGMRVQSHVGVSDAERAHPQELLVMVDLELAGTHYPSADELEQAADYAEIVRASAEVARERSYRLLETFALRLARRLGNRWPAAERVRVAVTKAKVPVLPPADEAIVEVCLGKSFT